METIKVVGQAVLGTGLDKPAYTVDKKEKNFEERHYSAAKWVSTKVMSMERKEANSTGFRRLFKYISGENEPKTKVAMTAPVTSKIEPGAGPNCESTFTVSFYIPPVHQADPPKPTNPDVFIDEFPEMKVFTSSFGGFATDEQYIDAARKLGEEIEGKENFHQDFYYTAGYDSPFKLFGRTNEGPLKGQTLEKKAYEDISKHYQPS